MTTVDFYTHVDDKLKLLSVLCGKALRQKTRVWISVSDDALAAVLDRSLWASPANSFLPHCLAEHALAAETPIIIGLPKAAPLHTELLINYCDEQPSYFSRFERLIELVSIDAADAERARTRYRFYQDRGYAIRAHDLSRSQVLGHRPAN